VWGNSLGELVTQVVFGDETNEVNSLPASMWDAMFPLDAQWPAATNDVLQPAEVAETTDDLVNDAQDEFENTTNTIEETTSSLLGDLTVSSSSDETTSPNDATSAPTTESASTTEAAPATTDTTSSGSTTTTTTGFGLLKKLGGLY
jgi:hypothetical protein